MTFSRLFAVGAAAAMVAVSGAYAQVDEAAKKAVTESYDAIQKAKFTSMHVVQTLPGLGDKSTYEYDVKILRGGDAPIRALFNGEFFGIKDGKQPLGVQVDVLDKATNKLDITWVDHAGKMVKQQKNGGANGPDIWAARTINTVLGPYDVFKNPFESDLRARKIEFGPAEQMDGVPCTVIIMTIDEKDKNGRKLVIGAIDKLPRMYQKYRGAVSQTWTFTKVSDAEFKPEEAKLKTPEGFKFEKLADPTPVGAPNMVPPAKAPDAANPTGLKNTPGGIKPGTAAPAWELTTLDGKKVKAEDFKGKTVVMGFWAPRISVSTTTVDTLNEVAAANAANENVKVFGVACRMDDPDDPADIKKLWESQKYAYPTLIHGDDVMSKMNIRGMPSFIVIDGEGKVKAFIESGASARQLNEAINAK